MEVKILDEAGYECALYGLGFSYDQTSKIDINEFVSNETLFKKVIGVSKALYNKEGGHNKFLESIQLWVSVNAPRFWHSEADTYRVGETKQSESTMHTIMRKPFSSDMFEDEIPRVVLDELEKARITKDFLKIKNLLPEGFLQKRIWNLNYKVLRNIIHQRLNHKLPQWQLFCNEIYKQCEHPEFLQDLFDK
jgi:hypothetical protein